MKKGKKIKKEMMTRKGKNWKMTKKGEKMKMKGENLTK